MRFSIVVTTWNRPAQLAVCLASLARLDYPRQRYEVIVVDDGGRQPLDGVVAAVAGTLNARLVRQANAGPASGRNHGARIARGEYLAFTDDDCEPEPQWLSAIDERLHRAPDAAVGGRTVNGLTGNRYSIGSQVIVDVVYAWYNGDPDRARFFATNNLAIPRRPYLDLGGLDERMRIASEDREFCRRWLHVGGTMAYEPHAVVVHRHPLSLGGFLKQHFAYGRGAAHFRRGGRRLGGDPGLPAQLSFYLGLMPRYLRAARRQGMPPSTALLLFGLWQGANTAGYLREVLTNTSTD